jgi:hypothetical protein
MQLGEMTFGANIKIPERQEDGSYKLADYTLGYFGAGIAAFIRKDIHSLCRFGDSAEYAGSDLDKRMTEIYDSYPDELKELIIPCTIPLYNGSGAENITRKVFAPTLTMVGCGDNHGVEEGLTWPIFTGRDRRKKTFQGPATIWWLSSQYSAGSARYVDTDGSAYRNFPSRAYGVVPTFLIPQSVQIDDTPDNDGSYRLTVLESYCS